MTGVDAILIDPPGVVTDEHGRRYEDADPALANVAALGVQVIQLESLSERSIAEALTAGSLAGDRVILLTATAAGIRAARSAGVQPVLMMNDPDEAMRLTAENPAGGIVSLHELPDFVRFVNRQSPENR